MSAGSTNRLASNKSISLSTPEAVELTFELATISARLGAFMIDFFALMLFTVVLLVVCAFAMGLTGLSEPMAIGLVGVFLVRQFYFTFFEVAWHGATPGKRALNIRVISRDGGGLTVDAVVTRNLLRDVELFLPLALVFAGEQVFGRVPWWSWMPAIAWVFVVSLMPYLTKERLRAGDLAAGTVVVRVPRVLLQHDEAARASVAPAAPTLANANLVDGALRFTSAQLGVYGEKELETLADLMRRINDGKATRADQSHIARTIAKKIDYDGREPIEDPTRFLRSFYKQQRAVLEKQLLFGKRKADKYE